MKSFNFRAYSLHEFTRSSQKAFTLVELIVTITILSILGTLGFISLQDYNIKARDTKRLNELQMIARGFETKLAEGKSLPEPDAKKITITMSGTILQIQGMAGTAVANFLGTSNNFTDPTSGLPYSYSVAQNRLSYQLFTPIEGGSLASTTGIENYLIPQAWANNLGTDFVITGKPVGILFASGSSMPYHEAQSTNASTVELGTGSTNSYSLVYSKADQATGTGMVIFSHLKNRRNELKNNRELSRFDMSLAGHWALEEGSGNSVLDSSPYTNTGTLFGSFLRQNGAIQQGIDLQNDSYIQIPHNPNLNVSNENFTVMMWGNYRDFTYPKGSFMIKKANTCYRPGSPGWSIGHTYNAGGTSVCFSDGTNGATERIVNFDPGYTPQELKGKWGTLATVFDLQNKKISFYVNGKKQSAIVNITDVTGSTLNSMPLLIGSLHGWKTDGMIDDIRIYKRALSEFEIYELSKQ